MKKLTVLATAIALSASASAFAVTAQSGVYVQAVGGWAVPAKPGQDLMFADGHNNKTYALGGNLGYDYAFNQNLMAGVEAGYLNLGSVNYTYSAASGLSGSYAKAQNWGYQVLATATYLANNGLNGFVKAGGIRQTSNLNMTLISGGGPSYWPSSQLVKWIPAAVVGFGYMPTQNLNVALQYEHTFGSKWGQPYPAGTSNPAFVLPSKPMTQNIFTLGVSYKFAM
jgi:opacity protein-like surface antigen